MRCRDKIRVAERNAPLLTSSRIPIANGGNADLPRFDVADLRRVADLIPENPFVPYSDTWPTRPIITGPQSGSAENYTPMRWMLRLLR